MTTLKYGIASLALGILVATAVPVYAQSENSSITILLQKVEELQERITVLKAKLTSRLPQESNKTSNNRKTIQPDSRSTDNLTNFRESLRDKRIGNTRMLGGGETNAVCSSFGNEHPVGTSLQTISGDGISLYIANGRALCERDGWQPHKCIEEEEYDSNCSLEMFEPDENWCRIGNLDIPNGLIVSMFGVSPAAHGYSTNRAMCSNEEIIPLSSEDE